MKKILSLLAAVLFAGSMMATDPITINASDITGIESGATTGLDATVQGVQIVWEGAYYNSETQGCDIRVDATKTLTFGEVKKAPKAPAQDVEVTLSSITTPGSLIWNDAVAEYGWWQITGENEAYYFSLSNAGEITEAAGTYTVDDLDPDFSLISLYGATDTVDVAFVDGSVTVAVSEEGIVTVKGTLVGSDDNNYIFNLTYKDPTAEKTVELNIPAAELYDDFAAYGYGLYGVLGYTAGNTSYVQLGIWTEEFTGQPIWAETEFAGQFTEDNLDAEYIPSFVKIGEEYERIFSANITVTPGATQNDYSITADLLCYNNTLYKVTMTIGAGAQGIEDVDAEVKAIKRFENGVLIIEKNGVKYNAQGAVVR